MEEFDKIVITSVLEAYASKTCSNCGYIKRNLGGNKEFRCDEYGLPINRLKWRPGDFPPGIA